MKRTINPDTPSGRFRVRWWDAGTSYDALKEPTGWRIYEQELGDVRWFEAPLTPQLVSKAESLLEARKHVRSLPPEEYESDSEADAPQDRLAGRIKVFICYAKTDQEEAGRLFGALSRAGFAPWMDKHCLTLGDNWEQAIKSAVAEADAFLVCIRPGFEEIGFRQQEVRWALDALRIRPLGQPFILPFIVEPCQLPDWCKPFHAGDHLRKRTSRTDVIKSLRKNWREKSFI